MIRILQLTIAVLITLGLSAQDYQVSINGNLKSDNDTARFWIDADSSEFSLDIKFVNNSNNGVNIKVLRTPLSILEGTDDFYIWGEGAGPESDTSTLYLFVPAGTSSYDTLKTYFEPNNVVGTSAVKYTFFNTDYFDDKISFVVEYISSPTDIREDLFKNVYISNCFPNPASSQFNINYNIPSEVGIVKARMINSLGIVIEEKSILRGKGSIQFNTSDMENGLYLVLFDLKGRRLGARKVVVN